MNTFLGENTLGESDIHIKYKRIKLTPSQYRGFSGKRPEGCVFNFASLESYLKKTYVVLNFHPLWVYCASETKVYSTGGVFTFARVVDKDPKETAPPLGFSQEKHL